MGLGSSAASMAFQKKASDEQRKKEGIMNQQAAEDTALFNKQYYQDLTKRTEIQNMLRILDQNQRKADTAVAARAAVTGATPEQQLAGREVNRRTFADSVADIASNASQLRDQYLRDYQGQRNRYYAQRLGMQDQLAAIHANTANQWANAATNAFAAGGSMLANGLGGLKRKAPTATKSPDVGPISQTTTAEQIAKSPTRGAAYQAAQHAANNPLEKGIYGDLSGIATPPPAKPAQPAQIPGYTTAADANAAMQDQWAGVKNPGWNNGSTFLTR